VVSPGVVQVFSRFGNKRIKIRELFVQECEREAIIDCAVPVHNNIPEPAH